MVRLFVSMILLGCLAAGCKKENAGTQSQPEQPKEQPKDPSVPVAQPVQNIEIGKAGSTGVWEIRVASAERKRDIKYGGYELSVKEDGNADIVEAVIDVTLVRDHTVEEVEELKKANRSPDLGGAIELSGRSFYLTYFKDPSAQFAVSQHADCEAMIDDGGRVQMGFQFGQKYMRCRMRVGDSVRLKAAFVCVKADTKPTLHFEPSNSHCAGKSLRFSLVK